MSQELFPIEFKTSAPVVKPLANPFSAHERRVSGDSNQPKFEKALLLEEASPDACGNSFS
jgi:hypothetical protein